MTDRKSQPIAAESRRPFTQWISWKCGMGRACCHGGGGGAWWLLAAEVESEAPELFRASGR